MTENERLTHRRMNGIKEGYWSPRKKEELLQRKKSGAANANPDFLCFLPPKWCARKTRRDLQVLREFPHNFSCCILRLSKKR